MRKCGQRGGLTVRLEGFLRHPPPWSRGGPLFRHPTARGGRPPILSLVPVYPLPSGLIPVPWYQSAGSGGYKAAGRSRPPGLCHPRARWRPLRSYGRDAGRRAGDSFVASPCRLVNLDNRCRRGPTGWRRWCPSPLLHNNCSRRRGSSGWRHWRVSPLRHKLVGSPHGRPYGWRRRCPPPRATSCLRRQAWLT